MSSRVFDRYAPLYAAFYADKDYAAEARFVVDHLDGVGLRGRRVLELGCGQGGHAVPFAEAGWDVHGIDLSEGMIESARARREGLPHEVAARLDFDVGDIRTHRAPGPFDAVVSLFHVVSYLPENDDLLAAFSNARRHVVPGGLFAFDFWWGPAVLQDPPVFRSRHVEAGGRWIERAAEPELDLVRDWVDVCYEFTVRRGSREGPVEHTFNERHRMRFLFGPELKLMLKQAGFDLLVLSEWMEAPEVLPRSWNGFCLARADATWRDVS